MPVTGLQNEKGQPRRITPATRTKIVIFFGNHDTKSKEPPRNGRLYGLDGRIEPRGIDDYHQRDSQPSDQSGQTDAPEYEGPAGSRLKTDKTRKNNTK